MPFRFLVGVRFFSVPVMEHIGDAVRRGSAWLFLLRC